MGWEHGCSRGYKSAEEEDSSCLGLRHIEKGSGDTWVQIDVELQDQQVVPGKVKKIRFCCAMFEVEMKESKQNPRCQTIPRSPFTSCTSILRNQVALGRIERGLQVICLSTTLVRTPKDNAAKEQGDSEEQRHGNLASGRSSRRMEEEDEPPNSGDTDCSHGSRAQTLWKSWEERHGD